MKKGLSVLLAGVLLLFSVSCASARDSSKEPPCGGVQTVPESDSSGGQPPSLTREQALEKLFALPRQQETELVYQLTDQIDLLPKSIVIRSDTYLRLDGAEEGSGNSTPSVVLLKRKENGHVYLLLQDRSDWIAQPFQLFIDLSEDSAENVIFSCKDYFFTKCRFDFQSQLTVDQFQNIWCGNSTFRPQDMDGALECAKKAIPLLDALLQSSEPSLSAAVLGIR